MFQIPKSFQFLISKFYPGLLTKYLLLHVPNLYIDKIRLLERDLMCVWSQVGQFIFWNKYWYWRTIVSHSSNWDLQLETSLLL